jgi:membrane protease YdiL (CAAX protease family)
MTTHSDESADRVHTSSVDTDPQAPPSDETAGSDRVGDSPLRAVAVAVGLTVAALVVGNLVALVVLVPLLVLGGGVSPLLLVAVSVFGVQVVGFVGVSLLYARRTGRRALRVRRPTGRDALWVAGGVVAALLLAAAAGVVMTELGLEPTSGLSELGELDTRVFLVLIPLSVFVIAPTEELLFRGVVQGRLRESFGPVAAVIAASLCFGSIHFLNFGGPLAARLAPTLAIVLVSLLFGYAYERTGNLLVPVVMHGGYNAALLAVTYLSVVGV